MGSVVPFTPRPQASETAHRSPPNLPLRRQVEATIEALIDFLDVLDADPDLEADADGEPSLGWSLSMATGTADDCEDTGPEQPL
ncbi:hypothetical protein [Aureimonas sp. AU20]|uniref:hypothetical protein n=1 Tax=Aureimonas sp. AU20 TaxID=1349819 RepID=UPI00072113DC|nr:hypothetical protein [Aureimonas sp. AU20]ALN75821.1 hypothetical protein M673_24010 [Aureimonas sp. AU20]